MVRGLTEATRVIQPRTKVKTGCTTCRIRKIKCDEGKPACLKCVGTGRICDGYENPFQVIVAPAPKIATRSSLQIIRPNSNLITNADVEVLSRCLSTKTLFDDVDLNCDEEVKEVLQASLTDSSITHAVTSLKSLRKNLSRFENGFPYVPQQDPSYTYGIQQYSLALKDFVSGSSAPGTKHLRSILLCCQIFISIEQVQSNYSAMARHILGGLSILREAQSRKSVAGIESTGDTPVQLPLMDVFVIKLFAAPCKFLEPTAISGQDEVRMPLISTSHSNSSMEFDGSFAVLSNMRKKLKVIAFQVSDFLYQPLSDQEESNQLLQYEAASLLQSLEVWVGELKAVQENVNSQNSSLSIAFMYFLYAILRVVLLGKLKLSQNTQIMLETESKLMQAVADEITDKIRAFRQ